MTCWLEGARYGHPPGSPPVTDIDAVLAENGAREALIAMADGVDMVSRARSEMSHCFDQLTLELKRTKQELAQAVEALRLANQELAETKEELRRTKELTDSHHAASHLADAHRADTPPAASHRAASRHAHPHLAHQG